MKKGKKIELPITFESRCHEALISIWWTSVILNKESRRLFKQFNISEAQFNIMMLLKYIKEPLTQKDIAEKMLVDKSNITGLIDSLEKLNYIQRKSVEGDRRMYHVIFTEKGKVFINNVDKVYEKYVNAIMHSISGNEAKEIIRLTYQIRKNIAENQ